MQYTSFFLLPPIIKLHFPFTKRCTSKIYKKILNNNNLTHEMLFLFMVMSIVLIIAIALDIATKYYHVIRYERGCILHEINIYETIHFPMQNTNS